MKTRYFITISLCWLISFATFAQSETTDSWYQLERQNENAPKLPHQGMMTTLKIINSQRIDWDNFFLGWKLRKAVETGTLPIYANESVQTPFSKDEIQQVIEEVTLDTIVNFDPETYEETLHVVRSENPLFPTSKTAYQFIQDWKFDIKKQRLRTQLKAVNVGHWEIADKYAINIETLKAGFTIKNKIKKPLSLQDNTVTWAKSIYTTIPFYEKKLRAALLSKKHLLKHKVVNAADYNHILNEELIALSFQGAVDTLMDLKPQDFDLSINVVRQPDLDLHQITHFKVSSWTEIN